MADAYLKKLIQQANLKRSVATMKEEDAARACDGSDEALGHFESAQHDATRAEEGRANLLDGLGWLHDE